jgi:hypothetical protein
MAVWILRSSPPALDEHHRPLRRGLLEGGAARAKQERNRASLTDDEQAAVGLLFCEVVNRASPWVWTQVQHREAAKDGVGLHAH